MPFTPWSIIGSIWTMLLVVWVVAAVTTKRTVRRESGPARLAQLGLNVTAWMLMTNRVRAHSVLDARFVPDTPQVAWIGVALALAGAAFALWARFTIGRNWSGTITLKSEHELITRGPYSIVRHPIYTGLLLTLLGTALVVGEWRGLAAVALAFIGWKWKSLIEERVMVGQFGPAYETYRQRVKALIPFVL
ncbi:MAG TPA: isoprenylcysteine carboxylmethyltransferase family protein [Vicinamibacterales bacterium]|nr:isoprenylcysteine carboxylmethyltransferase family protein [Vicinamibacterales bacterium]